MNTFHYLGAALVLLLITGVGVWSGRQVKSAGDFATGGRSAGAGIVAGSLIGTLVGGASTIGTAQLAFTYGFSAWWFTLGGGIGMLIMALSFSKPLYDSGISTMPQIFTREYGPKSATVVALLTSIGSFLSIVSQVISGIALVTAVSTINSTFAMILVVVLMLFYVVFGGVWGAGFVGIAKTILLSVAIAACGIIAVSHQGGVSVFQELLPAETYFNLVARGAATDLGAGLSLVFGVLTTQAYIQAVVSAKSLKVSRTGLYISAILIPLVGVGGIFVGMYMKLNHPDIVASTALPLFIMEKLPPVIAGAVLATLLVALVGTGAGVALGMSSMMCNDIYKKFINKEATDKQALNVSRLIIVVILVAAGLLTLGNMGSLILSWSFLSMGLRGAVAFGPLCTALFLPGKVDSKFVMAAMIVGPIMVLVGKLALPSIDPLFPGMIAAALVLVVGVIMGRSKQADSPIA